MMTTNIQAQTIIDARLYRQTKAALMVKELELKRTKQQMQQLSKKLRGAHLPGRQLEAARDNAHKLIAFAVAFAPTSRRACEQWGISQRAWKRAARLLLAALDAYPHLYASEALDTFVNDLASNPKALRRAGLRYGKADMENLAARVRAATNAADSETPLIGGHGPRFASPLPLMDAQR